MSLSHRRGEDHNSIFVVCACEMTDFERLSRNSYLSLLLLEGAMRFSTWNKSFMWWPRQPISSVTSSAMMLELVRLESTSW